MAELNANNEGDVVINATGGDDSKLFFVIDGKGNCKLLNANEVESGSLSGSSSAICASDIGNETTVIQLLVSEANNSAQGSGEGAVRENVDVCQLKPCGQTTQMQAADQQEVAGCQNPEKPMDMPEQSMYAATRRVSETTNLNQNLLAKLAADETYPENNPPCAQDDSAMSRAQADLARSGCPQTRGCTPGRGKRRSSAVRRRQWVCYPRTEGLVNFPYGGDAGWNTASSARGFYPNEMPPGTESMSELCDMDGEWTGFYPDIKGPGYEDVDLMGPGYAGLPRYRGDVGYTGYAMDPTSYLYGYRDMSGRARRRRGRGKGRGGVRQYLQHRLLWARYTGRSQEALKRVLNAIKQKCR
nr:hypothetical protein BaRGS_017595 [Batillaria attramentaria]